MTLVLEKGEHVNFYLFLYFFSSFFVLRSNSFLLLLSPPSSSSFIFFFNSKARNRLQTFKAAARNYYAVDVEHSKS